MSTPARVALRDAADPRPAGACRSPRARVAAYAVALAAFACATNFYRLSEGTLLGDEAAFACTTDRMRATGDWVVPHVTDEPHLNATPLYNWLTLALAPGSDGGAYSHRFWSAAFGVGCVLVTLALGATVLGPEGGLLAGLLLATNRSFVSEHGARFGGMDAMLTFFVAAAALCYVRLRESPGRARGAWGLLGACIGLACLSKPPAFGCCFFALIVLHRAVDRGRGSVASRAGGPMLAALAAAAVAAPWYALLWSRLGGAGLHALFVYNSVGRALAPAARDPLCCHAAVWHSSMAFRFTEVALACAAAGWVLGGRRRDPLLLLAGGYLAALSVAGKAHHYVYYCFPFLAVLVAGLFTASVRRVASHLGAGQARRAAVLAGCLAAALLAYDSARTARALRGPAWTHPPVGLHQRLAPLIERGDCRLILLGFPDWRGPSASQLFAGANFEELYYGPRLVGARRVDAAAELEQLLRDGVPTVVVLPPVNRPQPPMGGLRPESRVQEGAWPWCTYPILTFNGAARLVPPAELTRIARGGR